MAFASRLARESKLDRALVIAFALAEVLVEAGERVGTARPDAPDRQPRRDRPHGGGDHPRSDRAREPAAGFAPASLSEIVVLSDLWSPIDEIRAILTQLSSNGSQGHLVQIVDPAEETFPYSGRIEFIEPEGAGEITAGRAETWRADYEARLERHRAEIRAETDRLGWSFTIHRTDRPASELLLALHARIGEGNDAAIGSTAGRTAWRSGGPHDRACRSALPQPLVLLGLLSLPVLWWLLRLIPPRPRRIEFPPTRLLFDIMPKEETPARTPWWLTLLRLTLAALVIIAAAGSAVESAGRDHDRRARRSRC